MKASYRDFTTGFYFNKPDKEDQLYDTNAYIRKYDFIGLVLDYDKKSGLATIEQRNKIVLGDKIEIFGPKKDYFVQNINIMLDEKNSSIEEAPHAQQIIKIKMDRPVSRLDMIRRKR